MAVLDKLEAELEEQIKLISEEFISRYLPANPEEGPDVYHQHVKAFCILAHAAFEEFVEQVSLALMMNAVDAKPPLDAIRLNVREVLTVYPRCALVVAALGI